jgi:hypothetical protein
MIQFPHPSPKTPQKEYLPYGADIDSVDRERARRRMLAREKLFEIQKKVENKLAASLSNEQRNFYRLFKKYLDFSLSDQYDRERDFVNRNMTLLLLYYIDQLPDLIVKLSKYDYGYERITVSKTEDVDPMIASTLNFLVNSFMELCYIKEAFMQKTSLVELMAGLQSS